MDKTKSFSTKFLEHLDSTVTQEEFKKAVEELMKFLVSMQQKNDQEIQSNKDTIAQITETLKNEHGTDLTEVKQIITSMVEKMMSEHQAKMQAMDEKMNSVQDGADGQDADEQKIVEMVLAKIPPVKELEAETADTLINKLEENDVPLSSLKALLDRVEALEKRPINVGGRGVPQIHSLQYYDLSASCDGNTKIFTIPKNLGVKWLAGTDTPAGQYRAITDYAVTGAQNRTLTLAAGSASPSTGATLHLLYVSLSNF